MRAYMSIELSPVIPVPSRPYYVDLVNSVHSFAHDVVDCQERCNRQLHCGHACTEPCSLPCKSDCVCEKEIVSPRFSGSPHLEDRDSPRAIQPYRNFAPRFSGSPHLEDRDSPRDIQPYRNFAAGGYVESDKNLAALGAREAAEARSTQLDEENFASLFSDVGDSSLIDKTKKMTLVRTTSNGKGGSRGVWSGFYRRPSFKNAGPSRKEEASLLD